MRRKQFKEDQIVRILEEFEKGKSVEGLCREYNVARSTIYMWRKKYGGIDKPMLKKLKELEKENARLKAIWPSKRSTCPNWPTNRCWS